MIVAFGYSAEWNGHSRRSDCRVGVWIEVVMGEVSVGIMMDGWTARIECHVEVPRHNALHCHQIVCLWNIGTYHLLYVENTHKWSTSVVFSA